MEARNEVAVLIEGDATVAIFEKVCEDRAQDRAAVESERYAVQYRVKYCSRGLPGSSRVSLFVVRLNVA